jgi:hypothetical protein
MRRYAASDVRLAVAAAAALVCALLAVRQLRGWGQGAGWSGVQ